MIATYIQELLATNNRVIVPNYGAFLVRATSKSKDANTLEEKLKDVYFSPFLKFNDELLEKYIIKKEAITKEQANEKITAFINDIKKELELEKPYIIKGFGQFTADKQGKVQFLTKIKETADTPSDTVGKKEVKKEVEKPAKASKSTTKAPATKTTTNKKEDKPKPARPVDGVNEVKTEPKPASPASELKEFKPETKSIYSDKKQKKPINKGLVFSIAIGVPLAAIFVWAILNFNTIKTVFNKVKSKTEKVEKEKTTTKNQTAETKTKKTQATDSAVKKEAEAKIETKTTSPAKDKPVVTQKKYYIIAGSFKNENYAISYMNKLKAEGYNAEKLAKRNGMHAVSFNSFADKKMAIAEYKLLANEKGLQAWILYH
jgi:nucleoid DNA-binding protein